MYLVIWVRVVRRDQSVKQCGKMRMFAARMKQVLHNQNQRISLRIVHTHMYIVLLPYVKQNICSQTEDRMRICVRVIECVFSHLQNRYQNNYRIPVRIYFPYRIESGSFPHNAALMLHCRFHRFVPLTLPEYLAGRHQSGVRSVAGLIRYTPARSPI